MGPNWVPGGAGGALLRLGVDLVLAGVVRHLSCKATSEPTKQQEGNQVALCPPGNVWCPDLKGPCTKQRACDGVSQAGSLILPAAAFRPPAHDRTGQAS